MPAESALRELQALAGLTKSKARKVEREAHELRRLAAQLHDAAERLTSSGADGLSQLRRDSGDPGPSDDPPQFMPQDTSKEETDAEEARTSYTHA